MKIVLQLVSIREMRVHRRDISQQFTGRTVVSCDVGPDNGEFSAVHTLSHVTDQRGPQAC